MQSKIYSLIVILFAFHISSSFAQSPKWLWAKSITTPSSTQEAHSIASDSAGNCFVTGSFEGTVDFDPGPGTEMRTSNGVEDIFILKLDPLGNLVWVRTIGGSGIDEGNSIFRDPFGNFLVTGYFENTVDFSTGLDTAELVSAGDFDVFVLRINLFGNFMWVQQLGGPGEDQGQKIDMDPFGNILTVGYFSDTADFNPDTAATYHLTSFGSHDIFISKLTLDGSFIWAKNIGGTNIDRGFAIATDQSGNVYSTGYFWSAADFDPGPGTHYLNASTTDIFISKLDSAGNFVWAKSFGGGSQDAGNSIEVNSSNEVYATGYFNGNIDFDPDPSNTFPLNSGGQVAGCLINLGSAGTFKWAKALTSSGNIGAHGISLALDRSSGNVSVAGMYWDTLNCDPGVTDFQLPSNGINDIYISQFDSAGNFRWAKAAGGSSSEMIGSISLNETGNIYVAGWFSSTAMTFDTITVQGVTGGQGEIYIAKLDNESVGIEENERALNFSLYPNPASDRLTIVCPKGNIQVRISDLGGRVIYDSKHISPGSFEIRTAGFSPGAYLVTLSSGNYQSTSKLMITR